MASTTISTIGYEGSEASDFIALLKHAGIDLLVDVRDFPSSRKKGFSKNALRRQLEASGIDYLNLKVLGDPKEGREAARSGKLEQFRQIFTDHIANDDAEKAMSDIIALMPKKHICLMCYERDHKFCHRSILIEKMMESCNLNVRNLGVPKGFFCRAA
jgi:uncharacterized protein (DUF488 family)